ncbi:MAG: signal peptidase I [Deltaproteobacteria bacterium]|nr:signal peptidase I [Deltaproteobacteria bacterium]
MKLFKVTGNSMYPVLRDNDLVVVKEAAPESLRRGNIIVYRADNGQSVVHRLVKKGKGGFLHLKGDGYNLPSELAKRESVIGKAAGFVRGGRYEPLDRMKELHSWAVSLLKERTKRFVRRAARVRE